MNSKIIFRILAILNLVIALFMLPSILMAVYFHENASLIAFLETVALMVLISTAVILTTKNAGKLISPREGLAIVSLGWIIASAFGALPLLLSGAEPSYIDGLFQVVSGFTTTGASVISDMEHLPRSILFWLSMTHWIGGMGILVFTIGLLPRMGVSSFQIMKAESPGPFKGKIEASTSKSAARLYEIYLAITVVLFILLRLAGMSTFESLIQTFGVVGTGGFSSRNASIQAFNSPAISIIMSVFMIICATNFSIYHGIIKGKGKEVVKDEEFRSFYTLVLIAIGLITLDLYFNKYGGFFKALLDSSFQVTSLVSTSGFVSADYDLWPEFSKFILLIMMIVGGCAGSTGGGVKVIRFVILFKVIKTEVFKIIHPRAVEPVKLNDKMVNEDVVGKVNAYLGIYLSILILATLVVTTSGVDILSSLSSVITTLSNVGPGFGMLGPTRNFDFFPDFYKILFSILMLLGRLEFFALLAMLSPNRRQKVLN